MNSIMNPRKREIRGISFDKVLSTWLAALVVLGLGLPLAGQDRVAVLLDQYRHENDPVRKARLLVKLGDDEVELAKKQLQGGDDVASLDTLENYRGQVEQTIAGLKATGVDAEKKPGGFKELQISLRENVRRVDDLIFSLPADKRPFFREARTALANMQNDLIDALFPRRGSVKKPNP
jgi:hypothetical protein